MKKQFHVKQVTPIVKWRECYCCGYSFKFEKMWRLLTGIDPYKRHDYLCKKCCDSEIAAEAECKELHKKYLKEITNG